MIYQQTSMIRLARGGRKLVQNGEWHPFGEDGKTHYRVVNRVMQRVRMEDGEDLNLYHLFDEIQPMPSRVAKEGFREEVCIRIEDDHYILCNMWLRAYIGWELLAEAMKQYNGELVFRGANSLEFRCRMDEFTEEELRRSLFLGKALGLVGPQLAEDARMGIPHIQSEVKGLLKSAYTVLIEEMGTPKHKQGKDKKLDQPSLF